MVSIVDQAKYLAIVIQANLFIMHFYKGLAKGPGAALPVEEKKLKKLDSFSQCHPQATHECPQKNSAHYV